MGRIKQQNFQISITADDSEKNEDFEFDIRAKKVLGMFITSKRLDQIDLRGSFKMLIDGKEIFPEDTDTKQFTVNAMVGVADKIHWFRHPVTKEMQPIPVGNRALHIDYFTDANALLAFAAHTIQFTFILELKDSNE